MYPTIVKCPTYEPKAVIGAIEEKFGYWKDLDVA
jgi:hypothetical protein